MGLTVTFLVAYLTAGYIAYSYLIAGLDERVVQAAEWGAESLEDQYRSEGTAGLIAKVNSRAGRQDPEDQPIWLLDSSGHRLAGHAVNVALPTLPGSYPGEALGLEEGEQVQLAVRRFATTHLLVGHSYEESDSISEPITTAFTLATVAVLLLSALLGGWLAAAQQRRLQAISNTLDRVAGGQLMARVPVSDAGDDIDKLALQVNTALTRLERNVEAIRQVSVDIAHDLRTPINRLRIQVEQAHAVLDSPSQLSEKLIDARREIHHITSTFDALLRIAQIEAGARKQRFQWLDISALLQTLTETYAIVAEESQQSLLLRAPSRAVKVFGDRDLLTQCYANLIENAIRHNHPQAEIVVSCGTDQHGCWVTVADNGVGIPEAELTAVTGRFYRLDKARHTDGAGLGLALVKAVCELHDAELTLADNRPGLLVTTVFSRSSGAEAQGA